MLFLRLFMKITISIFPITSLSSRIFSSLNDKITKLQKHIYFQYLIAKTHRSCHRRTLTTQKWRGSRAGVFVSGTSTCYQAHQALHTPHSTYHLLFSNTVPSDNKKSSHNTTLVGTLITFLFQITTCVRYLILFYFCVAQDANWR